MRDEHKDEPVFSGTSQMGYEKCPACEGFGCIRDFWDPPGHEDTCLGCNGHGHVTAASAEEIRRIMKEHGYV